MTNSYTHPIQPVQKTAKSVHELVERLARGAGMQTSGSLEATGIVFTAGWHGVSKGQLEAFAQLVARECAQICEETMEQGHLDMGGETRAYASASAICSRFGIEELAYAGTTPER